MMIVMNWAALVQHWADSRRMSRSRSRAGGAFAPHFNRATTNYSCTMR